MTSMTFTTPSDMAPTTNMWLRHAKKLEHLKTLLLENPFVPTSTMNAVASFFMRVIRTNNSRSSAPAIRTTGKNATKSSSSGGSSDSDPAPRRQTYSQQPRLILARALNATARFMGGAR